MEEMKPSFILGEPVKIRGRRARKWRPYQEQMLDQFKMEKAPLFKEVSDQPMKTTTVLVPAEELRNALSLRGKLIETEQEQLEKLKLQELYKAKLSPDQAATTETSISSASSFIESDQASTATYAQTMRDDEKLKYLMGLPDGGEEAPSIVSKYEEESVSGESESMRQAQKYLKSHQIFELFQFLIAHLLSELSDNPIQYIIDILDKCIMYRSGLRAPPLLYTRDHLEALFYLMDKMRTNIIEVHQYHTGMATLAICSYNKQPRLTTDGCVTKDVFVEEAYSSLVHLLDDMIRRRWICSTIPVTCNPPPLMVIGKNITTTFKSKK